MGHDLYKDLLLEHYRRPRNKAEPASFTHRAEARNPLCGDTVEVFLTLVEGRIQAAHFQGKGCAISQASASCMTEGATQTGPEGHRALRAAFGRVIRGEDPGRDLGELQAFAGVAAFPTRVRCAELAWRALDEAVAKGEEATPTEEDE